MRSARWAPLVVLIAALFGGAVTGVGVAVKRITSPPPALMTSVVAPATVLLDARAAPPIPVPQQGSFLLATDAGTVLAGFQRTLVRPTGSVAKTMTALLTLRAHPLAVGASGPVLTMTAEDVQLYRQAVAEQGSAVPVSAGERLTERQLLLALLLPSANNIAETLARWVAGSDSAFDAQLNAAALQMGMRSTHFADPSGYSPATVSTAQDLVVLGRAAIANPALEALVTTQSATLPDGTVLRNLDILLSAASPHWLGIKTGWTPQAGGCLLFAAEESEGAARLPVTLVGAVLGQPPVPGVAPGHPELGGAFRSADQAVTAALLGYSSVDLSDSLRTVRASVTAPWGAASGARLVERATDVLVRGPLTITLSVSTRPLMAPLAAGTVVGQISGSSGAGPPFVGQLVSDTPIGVPDWAWKLFES